MVSARSFMKSRRFPISWIARNENPRLKPGMVLAVEPMVNRRPAGSDGFERQVDGGNEGWVEFGALRALHRGDGKRAVGTDPAVKVAGRPGVGEVCCEAIFAVWFWIEPAEVLAHLVGAVERNFVRLVPGDRVEVELSPHDPGAGQDRAQTELTE